MLMPRPCNITRWEPLQCMCTCSWPCVLLCCEISGKFLLQICQEDCNLFYFITTQEVNNIISQLSLILENVVIASSRPFGVDVHEKKFMLLSFHWRKRWFLFSLKVIPFSLDFWDFIHESCIEERLVIDKWMNGMNSGCSCFIASFL